MVLNVEAPTFNGGCQQKIALNRKLKKGEPNLLHTCTLTLQECVCSLSHPERVPVCRTNVVFAGVVVVVVVVADDRLVKGKKLAESGKRHICTCAAPMRVCARVCVWKERVEYTFVLPHPAYTPRGRRRADLGKMRSRRNSISANCVVLGELCRSRRTSFPARCVGLLGPGSGT